jgi:hypothetical protein
MCFTLSPEFAVARRDGVVGNCSGNGGNYEDDCDSRGGGDGSNSSDRKGGG